MNFDELNAIIEREAGVSICPVCGVPFDKYHSRQKTCGSDECKRMWHNKYFRDRRKRLLAEDPEAFRAYRREAQRKTRQKKRKAKVAEATYEKLATYWVNKHDRVLETGGHEYGKKQVEKTLAQVPKIDTRIGEKK